MFDKKLKPILIEINRSPSWKTALEAYAGLKKKIFYETLDLVTKIGEKPWKARKTAREITDKTVPEGWVLLFNEETEFNYLNNYKS
jgi:hypothetical protein